jgi:hypothetical protein
MFALLDRVDRRRITLGGESPARLLQVVYG